MRVAFMGTPDFAVASLQKLVKSKNEIVAVITQPDKPKGRGGIFAASPVKEFAVLQGLNIWQPATVRGDSFYKQIADLKVDILVVVAYGKILPIELIEICRFGAVNVHASLLPSYRGAAPIHHAIINGEKKSGVTIMQLDSGMDTGNILCQKSVDIGDDMTTGELYGMLKTLGADLLIDVLDNIENFQIEAKKQNNEFATYAPPLTAAIERIKWDFSAEKIHNQIRGLMPWPGAYFMWNDKRVKVAKANKRDTNSVHSPGEVIHIGHETITVACGENSEIDLKLVQPAGKRIMAAGAMARGAQITKGQLLK